MSNFRTRIKANKDDKIQRSRKNKRIGMVLSYFSSMMVWGFLGY